MSEPTSRESLAYDFLTPQRIVFGWGRRAEIGTLTKSLGRRAFLVSGSRTLEETGRLQEVTEHLREHRIEPVLGLRIDHEPLVEDVDKAVDFLHEHRAGFGDFVVAVGGGSAIDLAKAAGAIVTNRLGNSVRDFLEGVGEGLSIVHPPLPLVALPTTGGTGTEVTKNAVISSLDPPFKKSLRSDTMIPQLVLIDPELHVGVSPANTAATGMDAITQLVESYISRRAKPIPRALALQGIQLAFSAIVEAYNDGSSRTARESLAHAALLSGMALANSGLGMAHGVAAALGIHANVPHGLACAVMLPTALRVNRPVSGPHLSQLGELVCGCRETDAADAFIDKTQEICRAVGIPTRLTDLGVRPEQIPAIVTGSRGNSMNGNPRALSDNELMHILEEML